MVVYPESQWLSAAAQARLIWGCLLLAIAARAVRFLLKFPLWEDECFLAANYIDRGYLDLLGPLNYHQVAPVLFLWAELTFIKLFGFSEWSLRLFPFLCSIGGLLLFRRLAARLLHGIPLLLAVAVFSLNYSGIRYAAEAKPYGPDQFVALVLLTFAVEAWRRPNQRRWLWLLAATAPLAVGLSYPALFVGGGISLALAYVLWTSGDRRGWIAWTIYNAALVGSFGLLFMLAARSQTTAELGYMQNYWKDNLPSLASPLQFAAWLVVTHTSELMSFPVGGERGASTLSFLIWLAGLATLCRARRSTLLLLCLAPAALNIAAALMGRYPYGGHVKFAQYLAPAICIIIGVGGAAILQWYDARSSLGRRALAIALALCCLVPLGTMARDFASPYKSKTDARYRDFARWFWFNMEFGGEVACLKTDLGQDFAPGTFRDLGWSAMYLCNQKIYSPRHARGELLRFDQISAQHPLRCVQFKAQIYKYDQSAFDRWLASMQSRYELVSRDAYPFPCFDQKGRNLLCLDQLEVYKFVPRRLSLERKSVLLRSERRL
ncbi:MAG TPA: glycosyltransferase family 39 protein [Pirellulales bacterium]|nr:glycosyltransferase family 39 protein [Pirellulales bacterium]